MSSVPTGVGFFSICVISLPSRSASGTPRRRIPMRQSRSTPPFFSTISCARRTSVRSISEADISCDFSRSVEPRVGVVVDIARHRTRWLSLAATAASEERKRKKEKGKREIKPPRRDLLFPFTFLLLPCGASEARAERPADAAEHHERDAEHNHREGNDGGETLGREHALHQFLGARIGIAGGRVLQRLAKRGPQGVATPQQLHCLQDAEDGGAEDAGHRAQARTQARGQPHR